MSKSALKCKGCGNAIDPYVCHCGESIVGNHPHDNHSPIPMGCDCWRVSARNEKCGHGLLSSMRLRCRCMGCEPLNGPYCIYCRADLYDGEFIQIGWFDPLFRAWWVARTWVRKLGPKRCEVCGKKYREGYDQYTCSVECFDDWLPF